MFSGIIAVGLIGAFLTSRYGTSIKVDAVSPKTQVAK